MGECEANNKTLNSRTLLIGETKSIQPQSNQIKFCFLGRGENLTTRRKTSQSRVKNQQKSTHALMTPGPGIEARPNWWKASGITTARHPCSKTVFQLFHYVLSNFDLVIL